MTEKYDLEEILSTFFVEYKAAKLPAEMDLAMNKALASLTNISQKEYQKGELKGRIDEIERFYVAYDTSGNYKTFSSNGKEKPMQALEDRLAQLKTWSETENDSE